MGLYRTVLMALLLFINGCASTGTVDPRDPLEGFNRSVFSFNEFMDDKLFEPVTRGYRNLLPDLMEQSVSNVFSNINDIAVTVNDILQFKFAQALSDITRLLINSTIGILGIVDVASDMGLPKHNEDFGQTLGRWGLGPGPYLVTPFFGPSSLRDVSVFVVDGMLLGPTSYIGDTAVRGGLMSLNYVDFKVDFLEAMELVNEATFDEYEFLKNAYFQKRASQVCDCELSPFDEEFAELDH